MEKIEVSLKDIYNEKEILIKFKKKLFVLFVTEKGAIDPSAIKVCKTCEGQGRIIKIVQLGPNMISQQQQMCYKL